MIRIVKLDRKTNYLIDSKTNTIVDKYDPYNPHLQLVITLEDSILTVNAEKIKIENGSNQIVVDYNDDRFIIDDGYQDMLIKAGYIVYKNYDTENIYDKDEGVAIRSSILSTIEDKLKILYQNGVLRYMDSFSEKTDSEIMHSVVIDNYRYTIILDTVNNIVSKNQNRKDNNLPFYPFLKQMDKYGTIYLSIFAQRTHRIKNEDGNTKFKQADTIVKELMKLTGPDYCFSNQNIKRRLIRASGI